VVAHLITSKAVKISRLLELVTTRLKWPSMLQKLKWQTKNRLKKSKKILIIK
jgi:hypothetical protein